MDAERAGRWGALGGSLEELMRACHAGTGPEAGRGKRAHGTYNPTRLFAAVCKIAPRFKVGMGLMAWTMKRMLAHFGLLLLCYGTFACLCRSTFGILQPVSPPGMFVGSAAAGQSQTAASVWLGFRV